MTSLFTPIRLGALDLPHRVVMAPMTRNRSPGGAPNALNAEYYAQRASAGLIITEGTTPDPSGHGYIDIPGLYDARTQEGWRGVAKAVKARGGHIFVQLMHAGRISHPDFLNGEAPVAPSAVQAPGEIFTHEGPKPHGMPRALEAQEIEALVGSFGRAATLAVEAGIDGVEVHGANGYLPAQFLAPNVNRREDEWGGTIEKRARFLLAATDAAIAAVGGDRVGVRLSPGVTFNDIQDPEAEATHAHVIAELAKRPIAYLHVVDARPGWDVAGQVRRLFPGTLILNGGYDRARAEADLAAGKAEMISFGAPFIANPDLPARLREGAALNQPDKSTFYGGDARGYTDYPALAA
ncbi:alkene reductase [Sabulicella glaciei]|uniref:Alkene reductase n=1 Tax=Sabulicella glaciei TaxID=2984948 RepID=A0ABT3P026_9PROT|nr:alkene reductase [Roseococcus sp. MDT2-1-1]MCW8087760.1 alkene reductase [Roseococcus sp. MDT2-1-1]